MADSKSAIGPSKEVIHKEILKKGVTKKKIMMKKKKKSLFEKKDK